MAFRRRQGGLFTFDTMERCARDRLFGIGRLVTALNLRLVIRLLATLLILRYVLEASHAAPHNLLFLWRLRIDKLVPTLIAVV